MDKQFPPDAARNQLALGEKKMDDVRANRSDGAGAAAPARPRLGEMLVAQGEITREQLAVALERQKTSGRRLGEELVKAGFVKRSVVNRALRTQHRLTYLALCSALAATTIAQDTDAATRQTQIAVTAYVPPNVVSQVEQQAAALTITDADVARGYVEIPAGSRLRVTSNDPAGFVIDFFARLPIFKAVRVSTPGASAQLGPLGGAMAENRHHGRNIPLELSYRFDLADHVQPGIYPWPLALNVRTR
jgi:hypothetical protein